MTSLKPKLSQLCLELVVALIAVPWAGALGVLKQRCDNACLRAQPKLSHFVQARLL